MHSLSLESRSSASFSRVGYNNSKHSVHDWPLGHIARSHVEDVKTPLAIDFSFLQSSSDSLSTEDIWDGENVNSGNVSKWMVSKLKSIATIIGVAFSGYKSEIIHLLSKIEKISEVPKQSVQKTTSAIKRQRELKRLEFGVNYDRVSASSDGMLVAYV